MAKTKRVLTLILLVVLLALLWQLYQLYRQNRELEDALSGVNVRVQSFEEENRRFQADLEYFSHSENLEKELRSRYNYKNPGEKLIILVQPDSNR
jgi:cell division protein FtsB